MELDHGTIFRKLVLIVAQYGYLTAAICSFGLSARSSRVAYQSSLGEKRKRGHTALCPSKI